MTLVEIIPAQEPGLFEVLIQRKDAHGYSPLEYIDHLSYTDAFDYASVLVDEGAVLVSAPW